MRATLTNYVCWKPEVVAATIATEAPVPSSSVLLATHTPLRIRQLGQGESGEPITESDFLEEFLKGPAKEGVRIAPILGQSGSGKSHLVRWAQAKIPAVPGRHVIYLPKKRTSLRDVIEELLLDQTGPAFDEMRSQLGGLREAVDSDRLKHRILDELAAAVREAEPHHFLTKVLVGERGLYVLLHDPFFREYMLRSGSFIARRAEHALHGRGESDEEVPPSFAIEDLPLSIVDHANISESSAIARTMYKRLSADPKLQETAIDLLNEHLDVAVMRAADLGVGSIQRAFLALREQLVGQEIILLIEDFALIQGIRRDLLDAIVEVGTVAGVDRYATVRTMMAVTTGYYGKLDDTFRTRAEASSPVYTVDVTIDGAGANDDQTLVDFVGRYLNAARLGAERIEASPGPLNACLDCPLMDECHATFGATRDGYGLYPYNEPAIRRAISITADTADPERRFLFNPRRVLSKVVKGVLTTEGSAIRDGRFPSPEFLRDDRSRDASQPPARRLPDLALPVREAIYERYEEPERGRYTTTFQFWGGLTPDVGPGVYKSFSLLPADLPANDVGGGPSASERAVREPQATPAKQSVVPPSLLRQLGDIDEWSKGSQLPQAVARDIRNIVRAVLVSDLDWTNPILKDPPAAILKAAVPDGNQSARTVSIDGSPENLPMSVQPIVRFERNPRNAIFFQSLLRFKQSGGREAPEALMRLRAIADECRAEVVARVVAEAEYGQEKLAAAGASLIAGAALCGQLPQKPKLKDYVAAMLWSGKGFQRADAARTSRWTQAEAAYLLQRETAVEQFRAALGASQGGAGGVHAVDDPRVREVAQAVLKLQEAPGTDDLPVWCRSAERARKVLEANVSMQVDEWRSLLREIRQQVPADTSYAATVDAVIAATGVGQTLGFVKANLAEVETGNRRAKEFDFVAVTRLEASLDDTLGKSGTELASIVGRANADDVVAICDYLLSTSAWLEAGLGDAEGRERGGAIDVDEDIEKVLEKWVGVLNSELEGETVDN